MSSPPNGGEGADRQESGSVNTFSLKRETMGFIPVKFTLELRYSLIGFKIFGLAPYSDQQSWNVALLLYSAFLVALTLLCACSAFFLADIFSSQASTGTLASIIGQLMFCGLVATSLINLLQAVIFREEATQLEERLDTIHSLITEKLFIEISCAHIQRRLCWKIFAIVLFLIVVYGANFYALAHYNESVGYNLHSLWPIVIIRARCIHNIFQVDLITAFLSFLNAKLEAIVEISSRHKPTDQFEQIKYAQAEFKQLTRSPYTELMILKDVYGYVWDITNLINDAFGWSLLAVATQNFIEFTCNGYWLFLATDNQLSEMSAISEWKLNSDKLRDNTD